MRHCTLTLAFLGLFAFSGALFAQGAPEGLDCVFVDGGMELEVGDTNLDGTVNGDLEGAVAGEITETEDLGFGTLVSFTGSIADVGGNLETNGLLLTIPLDPMGMMNFVIARFGITGGDGDYEDASGVIFTVGITSDMSSGLSYFGVICTPKDDPKP